MTVEAAGYRAARIPGRPIVDPGALALRGYVYAVVVFLLLPTLIIVPMSFSPEAYLEFPPSGFTLHWYMEYFGDRRWRAATVLSLQIACLTAICAAVIGTMAAYAMVRGRALFGSLLSLFVVAPIIVPHIALAVALYLFFQNLGLVGSMVAFVAAHTVLTLPFFIFTVAATLARVDPDLESAAMSCGASRPRAFFNVTLPLIMPNVLSGSLFAFIISFDEPVVSFFLSSIRDRTLPRRMFENVEQSLTPEIPAIATLLTLLSITVLVGAFLLGRWGRRRKLG